TPTAAPACRPVAARVPRGGGTGRRVGAAVARDTDVRGRLPGPARRDHGRGSAARGGGRPHDAGDRITRGARRRARARGLQHVRALRPGASWEESGRMRGVGTVVYLGPSLALD